MGDDDRCAHHSVMSICNKCSAYTRYIHEKEYKKREKDDEMTNTLKIPGKIVGIHNSNDGELIIATETQVFSIEFGTAKIAHLLFDITDYQDKPTEKELQDIKDQKTRLRLRFTYSTDETEEGKP